MDYAEKIAHLRLIRTPYIGPATYDHLIAESGDPQTAIDQIEQGIIPSRRKLSIPSAKEVTTELSRLEKGGGWMLFRCETAYPRLLRESPQAPSVLSCIGNKQVLDTPLVAIVGARNASHAGLRIASKISKDLSNQGFGIVSGMARGIDTVCHQESLQNGTIAVLAGGIDRIYPQENGQLYTDIQQSGLIISEMPLGYEPQARLFPRRNRIIAGLCQITIVIESSYKSGSGITANFAADFGRELGAVPGSPLDSRNLGTLKLIKDGAHVITCADDVIEILNGLNQRTLSEPTRNYQNLAPVQKHDPDQIERIKSLIIDYISVESCPISDLLIDISASDQLILSTLAELELEGRIKRHWDNRVSRL